MGSDYLRDHVDRRRMDAGARLMVVAELKSRQAAEWRRERIAGARSLSALPALVAAAGSPGAAADREAAARTLAALKADLGYESIALLDEQANPVVGGRPDTEGLALARRAIREREIVVSDLSADRPEAGHLDIAAPLTGDDGRVVGATWLRLNAREHLFPLLAGWPAPSDSADTAIVRRDGGEVVVLSPLRHRPRLPPLRLPADQPGIPIVEAVKAAGGGSREGLDERGIAVLAAGRAVPGTSWVVVTQVGAVEAFRPLVRDVRQLSLGLAAAALLGTLVVVLLWRRQQHVLDERLALVMRHANDAILLLDESLRVVEANDRAATMFGYSREELRRLTLADLQAAGGPVDPPAKIDEASATEGALYEALNRRRDGATFPVEVSTRSVRVAGKTLRLSIVRDISERKAQAAQLERMNRMYRALSHVNEALVRAEDAETLEADVCRILVEDGGFRLAWIGEPGPDAWLAVRGRYGVERYLEEVRVSVDEARPEGLGPAGCAYREGEPNVRNRVGTDPAMAPWRERAAAHGLRAVAAFPLRMRGPVRGVLTVYSDQEDFFQDAEVTLLEETAQDLSFALDVLARDVERRAAEAALRESQERYRLLADSREAERNALAEHVAERTVELRGLNEALSRANRMKDEFLASMSHELRTPLNAILGLAEALQENVYGPLRPPQSEALRTVEESGRHLLELINDILDLSKIEAGKVTLETSDVALAPACEAALRFVRGTAQRKGIHLESTLEPEDLTAHVDGRRFRQIVVNLLSNSVKFTPEGGHVGLHVSRDGESWVKVEVRDTGIGISKEDLPRLFQPFTQLDSSLSRQHEGTGLGLALVQRLTELHGGRVTLESEPGRGTRVAVSVPTHPSGGMSPAAEPPRVPPIRGVASAAATTGEAAAGRRDDRRGEAGSERPLVLLAEDNEANVRMVRDYLEELGYRVEVAGDGEEAVAKAADLRPALVLMDVQMPRLDGLAATRLLRASPATAGLPVVALTALAMPGDKERCLEAGANAYLPKPVRLSELRELVHSFVGRAG
ncbi:MAG: ATP-binding protein [Vicinamibacteria bacterium]